MDKKSGQRKNDNENCLIFFTLFSSFVCPPTPTKLSGILPVGGRKRSKAYEDERKRVRGGGRHGEAGFRSEA